jgi:cellobiose-specific phosphotransferase system component IIC
MADTTRSTQASPSEQTLGGLVATAWQDISTLVHGTIELAKAELRDDARRAVVGAVTLGAVAFLGVLVVILLSIAAAYGLVALGLAPGWAFLIIAGAYVLVALILALIGIRALRRIRPPERTIRMAKGIPQALRPSG